MNWMLRTFFPRWFSMLSTCLCLTSTATAHPGHGVTSADPDSIQHYMLEPLHIVPVIGLAAVAAVAGSVVYLRRRSHRGQR